MKKYKYDKPIAVKATSNFGGIEILDINYGIEDTIIVRENYGKPTVPEKRKLRHDTNGNLFFIYKGNSEYLDEYLKVDI